MVDVEATVLEEDDDDDEIVLRINVFLGKSYLVLFPRLYMYGSAISISDSYSYSYSYSDSVVLRPPISGFYISFTGGWMVGMGRQQAKASQVGSSASTNT